MFESTLKYCRPVIFNHFLTLIDSVLDEQFIKLLKANIIYIQVINNIGFEQLECNLNRLNMCPVTKQGRSRLFNVSKGN